MQKSTLAACAALCLVLAAILLLVSTHRRPPGSPLTVPRPGLDPKAPRASSRLIGPGSRSAPVAPLAFGGRRENNASPTAAPGTAHRRFADWAGRYFAAPEGPARLALLAEGRELAAARREALAGLIESNPMAALELAAPWKWHEALPAEIAALLEQRVSGRGAYQVYGAVPLEGEAEFVGPILRYVTLGGRTYRAFVYGSRSAQISRPELTLHGIAIRDALAVDANPLRVLEPDEATALLAKRPSVKDPVCSVSGLPAKALGQETLAAYGDQIFHFCRPTHVTELNKRLLLAEGGRYSPSGGAVTNVPPISPDWTQGPKRVLFLRLSFPDDPVEPISEAEATALMNQVNTFYVESSFNKTTLIPTITPLLTLPQPKTYYSLNGPGTLLNDARRKAAEAGYLPGNYDLDIARFQTVPGFKFGGLASVGGRGVWLQSSGLGVVCHELGHNYGLLHANFWNTRRPAPPPGVPADTDSVIGFDSVIGPGHDIEYGDVYDTMGGGGGPDGHFNALHKYLLRWIPDANARTALSGTNRLYAHDAPPLYNDRLYLLRVPKDTERAYWISYRSRYRDNPWSQNGVELHWNNWPLTLGTSQLLDTTPGTPMELTDAALVVGRTFSDLPAGVHITPIARGVTGTNAWIDVVVNVGFFPTNAPPAVDVIADRTRVAPGAAVTLNAGANDPDGDPLVFYWDFGDGTFSGSSASVTKSWAAPGDYVVRCEVSDMKGGMTSRHLVITVGSPATLRISGRVTDGDGTPLAGVRVHNGAVTNNSYASTFKWTYTDSEGRYSLVNLAPDTYTLGAHTFGYVTGPLNFANPITLAGADAESADFLALALPDVRVKALGNAAETGPTPASFEISRTHRLDVPLRVLFHLGGSAAPGSDYADWPRKTTQTNIFQVLNSTVTNVFTYDYVDLPTNIATTNITITPLADATPEGDETVDLDLAIPIQSLRITDTATNTVFVPGWELLDRDGQSVWFQTYPDYAPAPAATASLRIIDKDPPARPVVSIVAIDKTTTENERDSGLFLVSRFGRLDVPVTVPLQVGGTATPGADYLALPDAVHIPAGETAVRVPVVAVADFYLEGNETVEVSLGTNADFTVGIGRATITIVDNDLPLVTVNTEDLEVREGGGTPARLVVSRAGDIGRDLVVDYLVGGTATSGRDFDPLPGTVTIPAGAQSATVLLTPRRDTLTEGDETVILFLADSPLYNVGWPNSATVTILDDQLPRVNIAVTDDTASEPADPGEMTVTRTGDLSRDLIVHFMTGGEAIHQADYAPIGSTVRIPAGAAQAVIPIIPIDDPFREDPESVVLELLPDPAYVLGSNPVARLTLNDDDSGAAPAVGFALLSSSAPESADTVELAVRVSANPAENAPIAVSYRVSGGTATAGEDYETVTNGVLLFSYADPGTTNNDPDLSNRIQTIPIKLINDTRAESAETIVVTLYNPIVVSSITTNEVVVDDNGTQVTNLVVVYNGSPGFLDTYEHHTLTIVDDDACIVRVEATTPDAYEEGPVPGAFTISRTGATNRAQVVYFQVSGSAASGSDFAPLGDSVEIPAGLSSVVLPVYPVDDPVQEFPETVTLTLYSAPGAQIAGSDSATVTLHDNDGTIEFASVVTAVREGAGEAEIQVRYSGSTNREVTVDYSAVAGTATAGADFMPVSGTLTFAPGDTVKSFFVPLVDDLEVEPAETVDLVLSNPSGGAPLGGQNTSTLLIIDDDTALDFSQATFSVNENATNALVTVRRTGVLTNSVSVDLITRDGTALAGSDYTAVSATLTFAPGEETRIVQVPIRDDTLFEGDETFLVTLTNAVNAAPGMQAVATVVIRDDECRLEFDPADYAVLEFGGFVTLNVHRSGGTANTVRVDYQTRDGSAASGPLQDFYAQAGTLEFRGDAWVPAPGGGGLLVFQPGETNQTISIRINDDALGEHNETFSVGLKNPRPAASGSLAGSAVLGAATNATVTILDNETPGHADYEFNPGLGTDGEVRSVAVEPDGGVLVAGDFSSIDGVVMSGVGRLHSDGYLDSSFDPGAGANGPVHAVSALSSGKVLIGGNFTSFNNATMNRIARLNADGSVDAGFAVGAGADGPVLAVAETADGRLLAGGQFSSVGGQARRNLVRLLPDGSVDPAFQPGAGPDGPVLALATLPDGSVLIGGAFTAVDGSANPYLARLKPDGTPDPVFSSGRAPDGAVHDIFVQPDGRIVIGGDFAHVGVAAAGHVARLNADGTPDATFDTGSGADGAVYGVSVHVDGRVALGGDFTSVNGTPLARVARLNPDGSIDAGFNPGAGANDTVLALRVQPDSAIVIGGRFASVDGLPRNHIARVHGDEKFALGLVQFSSVGYQVLENAGTVSLALRRLGNLKGACTVGYRTLEGSASAGSDYESAAGTLSFAAGEIEKVITVSIRDDSLAEGNETFSLVLTNAVGVQLGDPAAATVTIVDDESAVGFSTASYRVSEGAAAARIIVNRSGNASTPFAVQLTTEDASATAGADYVPQNVTLEFAAGETTKSVSLPILPDTLVEGDETVRLVLSNPTGGVAIGSQGTAILTIVDDDLLPTFYTLTMLPSPAGTVSPGSGRYPTNSIQVLAATPARGFEFVRWEGTLISPENPLFLTLTQDVVLTARFRVRGVLEGFESGDLLALPWTGAGATPWSVQSQTSATGRYAARSGPVSDGQSSSLLLNFNTAAGVGAFDLRVSSEFGWDELEFYVNGSRLQRWSGDVGWQTYQFPVPAGPCQFEWRYRKDANFSAGLDAAFIDNLYLPPTSADPADPASVLSFYPVPGGTCLLKMTGQPGRVYVLETSEDLQSWTGLSTNTLTGSLIFFQDLLPAVQPARFYRAIAR